MPNVVGTRAAVALEVLSGHGVPATSAAPGLLPAVMIAAAGVVFLTARPVLQPLPAAGAVIVAGYVAFAAASLCAPVPRAAAIVASPARRMVVLGLGIAAVLLVRALAAPAPPPRVGALALVLGTIAAVAEEALLRRLLYGWLERHGAVVAVAVSALVFAAVHLPSYGFAALPVDLGAGLLLSWQRWASGGWTAPALTHAWANLLVVMLR